jgi:hypothetical protein
MNPKTIKTLLWASMICLLPGMLVTSPAAGFLLYSLATILAVFPAVMSKKGLRLSAVALLAVSLLLAFDSYPKFKKELQAYRTRSIEKQTL